MSRLLWASIILSLCVAFATLLGIYYTPIPDLPHPPEPTQLANMTSVRGQWFAYNGTHEASITLDRVEWLNPKFLRAYQGEVTLLNTTRTRIRAETVSTEDQSLWIFENADVYRHYPRCLWHAHSARIRYQASKKIIETDAAVRVTTGRSHVHMQGIWIPLNEGSVTFGRELYGRIDPEDACRFKPGTH